ncbi:hypothetical protein [Paenibacillus glacialis]|uniref:Uncharacterized protein n=1 Tax=Paenibacillus glacialis TaxID=494026 RepID=A0A168F6Y8_9BACL|nr:hypothetical protein [Paenibacillus glacialis]OAB35921.1 hypothetical protein PGLA_21050 [Paenibacillus glacialis]
MTVSVDDLLKQARDGKVDVKDWGYTIVQKLEEALDNLQKNYLNYPKYGRPSILNSDYAGSDYKGVKFDPLGFLIFDKKYIKTEVNLLDSHSANDLLNMSRPQHLRATTKMYFEKLKLEANEAILILTLI